jgi:hypothetical protein
MYEPYPATGSAQEQQPERPTPPRAVLTAVRLMYAGAALELVAVIVAVVSTHSLQSTILGKHPGYTAAQLHDAEVARTVILIIGALIAIGLWLWMARANGRGHSWARVVSAVLFGINTLDLIFSLGVARAPGNLIVGVVIWLVGLAAIVMLFRKESGPFFTKSVPS